MKHYAAVIGHPIRHSLSPAIFSLICARKNGGVRPAERTFGLEYDAVEVEPSRLASYLREAGARPGFVGLNVTLPHKEAVALALPSLTTEARAVGAVNVVHFDSQSEGEARGHNTDVTGIRKTWSAEKLELSGRRAILLGAGGAARAALYALGQECAAEVAVWNRTPGKARELCAAFSGFFPGTTLRPVSEPDEVSPAADVIVQATSAGMAGGPDETQSFAPWLERARGGAAFDLVYRPERTPFLEAAAHAGLRAIGGLDMLIDQALDTWEIWFGALHDRSALRVELRVFLRNRLRAAGVPGPVVLVGMMGSGKSSVGRALAHELGWEFVDLDERIEETAGKSIPRLFEEGGEATFRKLEEQALLSLSFRPAQVIALGGGAFGSASVRDRVLNGARSVYLSAGIDELERRLSAEAANRPLLKGLDREGRKNRLQELFSRREGDYLRAAIEVPAQGRSPETLAREIIARLRAGEAS